MSRPVSRPASRGLALVLTALLLGLLTVMASLRPVPYVAMRPGPVHDTLGEVGGEPVVEISGRRTYPTTGRLDLTTVSVTSPGAALSVGEALLAWIQPDRVVLPREAVYPVEQSPQEAEQQSDAEMISSQDAAIVAALTELGIDVEYDVRVQEVVDGAPAQGDLESGDVILAVEGHRVDSAAEVGELLQRVDAGDPARLEVRRDGRRQVVTASTGESPDDPGRTIVGITVANDPVLPFHVSVQAGERIGGPSAGLMFALAILDRLTPGALTGGQHVAGTGAIDPEGRVGAIGGIAQKVAAAADAGAELFLVPARNCREALTSSAAQDLRLVRVRSLDDAVEALQDLAAGREAAVPTCAAAA